MEFIKKHKLFITLFVLFIILAFAMFIILQKFIIFHGDTYGNRLDDIDKVSLDQKIKTIENAFSEKVEIEKSDVYVTGRILNIINTVNAETSLEKLQEYGNIIFENVTEEERNLYDIQIIYKKEAAENLYPVFGYLGKGLGEIKWSYQS